MTWPARRPIQGRHFRVFQEGGPNFDRLSRGAKYEKNKNVVCKNTKNTIFQNQWRGRPNAPLAPSPNDVPGPIIGLSKYNSSQFILTLACTTCTLGSVRT